MTNPDISSTNALRFPASNAGPVSDFSSRFPRWMRIGFWACIAIAVAAVVARAVQLLHPPGAAAPPQLAGLDRYFAAHAALTWTHILCALVFVALLPLLFWSRTRSSRTLERAFFFLGFVVAATAYAMSVHAIGGWIERSAVLLFNTLFLASLVSAFVYCRRQDHAGQRRWMLRAIAILLGIATTRPVMGVFFATSPLTHLTPHQFFGVAFWIGFSTNTVAMELWLRSRRTHAERITP
jgi:uncharacterized membrane protein YsdA (DUF1294 family)